jgi:hypothetical protein
VECHFRLIHSGKSDFPYAQPLVSREPDESYFSGNLIVGACRDHRVAERNHEVFIVIIPPRRSGGARFLADLGRPASCRPRGGALISVSSFLGASRSSRIMLDFSVVGSAPARHRREGPLPRGRDDAGRGSPSRCARGTDVDPLAVLINQHQLTPARQDVQAAGGREEPHFEDKPERTLLQAQAPAAPGSRFAGRHRALD